MMHAAWDHIQMPGLDIGPSGCQALIYQPHILCLLQLFIVPGDHVK